MSRQPTRDLLLNELSFIKNTTHWNTRWIIYTKVNADGFKLSGNTFPSIEMQRELMNEILDDSGVAPTELSYMEAHGTGTKVGDPQEVEAIDCAIAKKRTKPLLIGSVKCSVGHTEAASGLNALAKIIIAFETGYIAPNIHLKNIKKGMTGFEEGRLIPVTELTKLDRDDAIVGINNFGFGGTNCHVLVKRFKKNKIHHGLPKDDLPRLVCVSGRTEKAVLMLLDNVNKKSIDSEYIRLLHEIFKKDVVGHCCRGYTIVSKGGPVKSDLKYAANKKTLNIIFGKVVQDYKVIGQYLMRFDCFNSTIIKINDILDKVLKGNERLEAEHEVLGSFSVQLGIVDLLKLLKIKPTAIYDSSFGQLVSSYYWDTITLEKAVYAICAQTGTCEDKAENFVGITVQSRKTSRLRNTFGIVQYSDTNHTNTGIQKKSITLTISDDASNSDDCLFFAKDNEILFLETLGRLYIEGQNLQLHKLYPEVEFPISRSTPMISPTIQWNHDRSWYTFKFGDILGSNITHQAHHSLSLNLYEDQKFLAGHVIDGRTLVPATKYLELVQKTYIDSLKMSDISSLPLVFENCKFVKAVTLPKAGEIRVLVTIQKLSGNFEIVEKNSIIATGRIYSPKNIENHQTDLPLCNLHEERTEFLEEDEIYREIYLRGYNYSGLFKGIAKCNVDCSAALIKWENNWTAFLDNMLQFKILQMNTRSLYVPIGIKKLAIDKTKHAKMVENQKNPLCLVYSCKENNVIKCGGVEMSGVQATAIAKKKTTVVPVLEKYVFVPNHTGTTLERSLRVIVQIVLENTLDNNFKAAEIIDEYTEQNSQLLSPLVSKALNDLPSVVVNLTIYSKNQFEIAPPIKVENLALTPDSNQLLIMATEICHRPNLLNQALNALAHNGFLLSREKIHFESRDLKNVEILMEHVTDGEKLILFQRTRQPRKSKFVEIMSNRFDWLPQLKNALKNDSDVVIYAKNTEPEGILGLINCLRQEPKGNKVRCLFLMDSKPKLNIEDPFYQTQLKKQMAVNIYKNGKWGTYRHLLVDDGKEVEGTQFFVKNTVKGDLSSLKWVEGNLSIKTKFEEEPTLVYPYYSALNFKDIMIASGRVNVDTYTTDRIEQECCQGFEFSGLDTKGRRVMGVTRKAGVATKVIANTEFLWEIPQTWNLQDASSVTVVYVTVIYGLLKVISIQPRMSILIHSATGGIGLAAINVCLYHDCDIFVTVGTQEKRNYLMKHYPQIKESHIGNSRDESFEEMIKSQTKGRGVDIVLNSLSEEKLRASVRCVARGGNFIEIGKFDLGHDAAVNMLLLERNVNYHGVMLDRLFAQSSDSSLWVRRQIYEGMKIGYIKPLPTTVFKRDEVVEAYKYMTRGKHIGKVVIQIRDENKNIKPEKQVFKGIARFTCDPEKSYVIVGGLGGFGLELADWLYLRGAKNLILVSRVGVQTGYQQQRIRIWRLCGVNVQIFTADVTTEKGCLEIINNANSLGPVDGIFNLAVVLKDSLFEDQSEKAFITSLDPKARATIYLDRITRQYCPQLKYFVVFSSVSCGRGNAGQTNYGMANSVMERICEKRKSEGLPALAIQWGAIGDVGLVAKMQKDNRELVIGGTLQQKITSCLDVLDTFLKQDSPIVSSMIVAEKDASSSNLRTVVDVVAYILGIKDIKTVSHHATFAELGMNSMMETEMIQTLEKEFEIYITTKEIRSLTFAKLVALEAKREEKGTSVNVTKMGAQLLLRYIPYADMSHEPIIRIPSQVKTDEDAKKIFLLPGVEGVFTGMNKFTKNWKAHIFGLQYINHSSTHSVKEYAKMILPHIHETISKDNEFFLVGYSFGTVVAVELTGLLEEQGFTGHLVIIEGAPDYLSTTAKHYFPTENEIEFQTNMLLEILKMLRPTDDLTEQKYKFLQCKTFDELFELAKAQVPPELAKGEVQKQATRSLYNRLKSLTTYKFDHDKIKSKVHLFRAKSPMISNFSHDYGLSEICQLPVTVNVVDGDHASILNHDQVIEGVNMLL